MRKREGKTKSKIETNGDWMRVGPTTRCEKRKENEADYTIRKGENIIEKIMKLYRN